MNSRFKILLISGIAALGITAHVQAHHSFAAAYDMETPVEWQGTLVDVRITNPHSHFFIEVEDGEGNVVEWKIEAGTPGAMIRHGYSPEVIREGDTVTIKGFQARNKSPNGMLEELITSDGTVWGMFAPVEN